MNLKSLMLTSVFMLNGVSSNVVLYEFPTSELILYYVDNYENSNILIGSDSVLFEYVISCDSSNVYIDFSKNSSYNSETLTISGDIIKTLVDTFEEGSYFYSYLEPLSINGDGSGTNIVTGYFSCGIYILNDEEEVELFEYHTNISYELYNDEILNKDGSNFEGELSADIYLSDDFDYDEIFSTFINDYYEPDSFVDSLFDIIGTTLEEYTNLLPQIFNDLVAIFYVDNKFTFVGIITLMTFGIGITKWAFNFVKEKVRL